MDTVVMWWNELGDADRLVFRDSSIVVAALIVGFVVKALANHLFVVKGVDVYLRFPWASPPAAAAGKSVRGQDIRAKHAPLTGLFGWFLAVSVWVGAFWWLQRLHGGKAAADMAQAILVRGWQVAIVVFPVLVVSGWIARYLYDLLQTPWLKEELDSLFSGSAKSGGSFSDVAAKAMCLVVYAAFFLLIPVAIAGLFNIASLQGLVVPAWQICARLLTALVVFAVGYLGLAWARAQAARVEDGAKEEPGSENRAKLGNQIGLGIVVATTILALGMIVGVSGFVGGVVIVAFFGMLLWPVRPDLRDMWVGLLLRWHGAKVVEIEGAPAQVKTVGPVLTKLDQNGIELVRRNQDVWKGYGERISKPPSAEGQN